MDSPTFGFENLEIWKRAVDLSAEMFRHLKISGDKSFRDHVTRTALSVPSNIAEGYERKSIKDSTHFYWIAKGSCGELRTQIIIGVRAGYIDQVTGIRWIKETRELSAMLVGLINSKTKMKEKESGKTQEFYKILPPDT